METEASQYSDLTESVPTEAPEGAEAQHSALPSQFGAPIDEFAPRFTGVPVELVLDSFRVIGELFAPGVPRRLVDILNSNDLSYFVMHSGTLDDPFNPSADTRSFDVIQLDRGGILLAIPRGEVQKPDPFKVTGNLHLMPDADPALVPIVADHHYVPFTDVTVVTDKGRPQTWHEPLVIVNMTRVLFYGTRKDESPAA